MKSERMAKVNELIQQRLASRLAELWNVKRAMASITGVETSPDLRHATVWVSLFATEDTAALEALYPELRHALEGLEMKYVPRLEFRLDTSGEYAERMEAVFRNIDKEV